MTRDRNYVKPEFVSKIRGILHEHAEDKVTPMEFVLYLLMTNKENGLYKPISRDALSVKVKGRDHYISEVYSDEKSGSILPFELATALANLTDTEPFFWLGREYSLAQANGIKIDMSRDLRLVPETTVDSVHQIESKRGRPR